MTKGVLVVLSGGQDSTTCLALALVAYPEADVHTLTFNYGQRHARELESAQRVARYLSVKTGREIPNEVVQLPNGVFAGKSPLTNRNEELERYASHGEMEKIIGDRVELTFVPMRNAVFLALAANRADVWNCDVVFTGVCQGDNQNYPDCRQEFVSSANRTTNLALGRPTAGYGAMEFATPLMYLSKAQTVKLALRTPHAYGALAFSHTAYDGAYPPTNDHASVLRAHGFAEAGVPDPLLLRAAHEGRVALEDLSDLYTGEAAKRYHDENVADWDGRF